MFDYERLLCEDEEFLKTLKVVPHDAHIRPQKDQLFCTFQDKPDIVYILPKEYKSNIIACCEEILRINGLVYIIGNYFSGTFRMFREDLTEIVLPNLYLEEQGDAFRASPYDRAIFNIFSVSTLAFSKNKAILTTDISKVTSIIDNIKSAKVSLSKNNRRRVSKIEFKIAPGEFFDLLSTHTTGYRTFQKLLVQKATELMTDANREELETTRKHKIRQFIVKGFNEFGSEFLEEIKSLTDEELLELEVTGKLPLRERNNLYEPN